MIDKIVEIPKMACLQRDPLLWKSEADADSAWRCPWLPDTERWHLDAVVRGQWFLQWSGKSGALWFWFYLADRVLAYAGIYPLRKRQKCNKTFWAAQVLSLRGSFYFIPNRRSQDSANIGLLMHFWKDKYPFKIWLYDKINQHKF